MAITDFERCPLTFGPSPVHELRRLSDHLGGARVWAKREDVNSGLAFGGNKTRKLEYIVPDILASGADTLVSIGGYQSNHTRQVAAVAAHLGLGCRLVQERWSIGTTPRPRRWATSNSPASWAPTSASTTPASTSASATAGPRRSPRWRPPAVAPTRSRRRLRTPARRTGVRQLGVRGRPTGDRARGLLRHDRRLHRHRVDACRHDRGFAALEDAGGRPRRIIGIDASATVEKTRDQVTRIAKSTAELIGLGREISPHEVDIRSGWEGPAYGIPDASTISAIRTTAELEGVIVDPVYEGKSMAGLIDLVSTGAIAPDSTVLYAHLGGQLALNAYSSIFTDGSPT